MTKSGKRNSYKKASCALSALATIVFLCGTLFFALQGSDILDLGPLWEGAWKPPSVVEEVEGPWYEVYFTKPRYPDRKEDRVGGLDERLVAAIRKAERSVDIAAYDFDLENVAQALIRAQKDGVRVRVLIDDENSGLEAVRMLRRANISVAEDPRQAIMHDKFVIIDGTVVWTGSWNLTVNGTYRNNNNVVVITSPSLAKNYTAEFDEMFTDEAFGPNSPDDTPYPSLAIGGVEVENYFAPEDDVAEKIIAQLKKARKSIRFMVFSFTDDRMGEVIREKFKAGLAVQGVFEGRGTGSEYSEYGKMRRLQMDVLTDGNPYTMHHKVFIIDDETVILGSFNFTRSADEANDENVLIIHDPAVAASYLAEFQRVYERAQKAD